MIAFLSGGYGPGGVQSIQLTLFKAFIARGKKCILFDVVDGWVYQTFLATDLPFEFVEIKARDKGDYSHYLTHDDLLIIFDGNLFGSMLLFSASECKALIWEVYYPLIDRFVYSRYFPIKWLAKSQELKILDLIVKHNAFFFIDGMGKQAVEARLSTTISNDQYLPIPIEIDKLDQSAPDTSKILVLTYVGRSVIWKIMPMVKVLSDVIKCNAHDQIKIAIVCNDAGLFDETLRKHINLAPFNIEYKENLSQEELKKFLKRSHLHIAMGTAALDGAKVGIPTLVIDASYKKLPDSYRYRWIYETDNLNLGVMMDEKHMDIYGTHTIHDVLKDIRQSWSVQSRKCWEHVFINYKVDNVAGTIINYKKNASLQIREFSTLLAYKHVRLLRDFSIR